jgi:hypothetical protein
MGVLALASEIKGGSLRRAMYVLRPAGSSNSRFSSKRHTAAGHVNALVSYETALKYRRGHT